MTTERFFKNRKALKRRTTPIIFLICAAFIAAIVCLYNVRVIPIVRTVGLSGAETVVQQSVSQALADFTAENSSSYENIIEYKYDANGNMISYSVNQTKANRLINEATNVISTAASVDELYVTVPVGGIFDAAFFNGEGVKIKFKMMMTTSSFVKLTSRFESQGINQTRHLLTLETDIPVQLVIPGKDIISVINSSFIVSDTVILGKVPDICLRSVDLST